MSDHTGYLSPLSERYASPAMQAVFSGRHRAETWRRLWVILAESEKELGLPVTQEQVDELRAHVSDIDFDAIEHYERKLRHDVMAHVHAYGDVCPLARPIIHLGATSCYVGDNADVILMREALLLLQKRLSAVAMALRDFAMRYKAMPTLGYTHFQPAQPTTVGKRAALWLQDVMSDLAACDHLIGHLKPLGSKGTTGTQASFLDLFEGDYEKVKELDRRCAVKMGFLKPVTLSGQTYSRKQDAEVLCFIAQIAQTAHKFSNDIRLLQHLKEIEEPFEKNQIGSSAMPYKRNPMRCERMTGIARFLTANVQNGFMTAGEQWLERTLDDSANRRLSIAEGFLAADGLLVLFQNVAEGLVVYPKMIDRHLREELPFMAVENILMEAVKRGGDRQTLHEKLRVHSMAAGKRVKEEGLKNDLLTRIAQDKDFPFEQEDIDALLDPGLYTGCAEKQVEDYVANEVDPYLAPFKEEDALKAEIFV